MSWHFNHQVFWYISTRLANYPMLTRFPNMHEETARIMHKSSSLVYRQHIATLNNSFNNSKSVVPARMKTGPSSLLVMNKASTFEHSSAPIPESHLPIASIGCFYSCIPVQCWSYCNSYTVQSTELLVYIPNSAAWCFRSSLDLILTSAFEIFMLSSPD